MNKSTQRTDDAPGDRMRVARLRTREPLGVAREVGGVRSGPTCPSTTLILTLSWCVDGWPQTRIGWAKRRSISDGCLSLDSGTLNVGKDPVAASAKEDVRPHALRTLWAYGSTRISGCAGRYRSVGMCWLSEDRMRRMLCGRDAQGTPGAGGHGQLLTTPVRPPTS